MYEEYRRECEECRDRRINIQIYQGDIADSRHHTGWDRGVFLLSHSFSVLNLGKGYPGGGEKRGNAGV
jgi:hypothetical protein